MAASIRAITAEYLLLGLVKYHGVAGTELAVFRQPADGGRAARHLLEVVDGVFVAGVHVIVTLAHTGSQAVDGDVAAVHRQEARNLRKRPRVAVQVAVDFGSGVQ